MSRYLLAFFGGSALALLSACSAGDYVVCPEKPEIKELSCNNNWDDDCDGKVDYEDPDCRCEKENDSQPSIDPDNKTYYNDAKKWTGIPANYNAVSICSLGEKKCEKVNQELRWKTVSYPVFPQGGEICGNGKDDNCNNLVDSAEMCRTCNPGDTNPDYPPGISKENFSKFSYAPLSRCKIPIQTCDASGNWLPPADPKSSGPVDETCNGVDDNCDGQVDEGTSVSIAAKIKPAGTETFRNYSVKVGEDCWRVPQAQNQYGVCQGIGYLSGCQKNDDMMTSIPNCQLIIAPLPATSYYAKPNSTIPKAISQVEGEYLQGAKWDWDCDGKVQSMLCLAGDLVGNTDSQICKDPKTVVSDCRSCPSPCSSCYGLGSMPLPSCGSVLNGAYVCTTGSGGTCSFSSTGMQVSGTVVCR